MEVGVHVEARGAEVVGARHVRDEALAAAADLGQPHPHVPVPGLVRRGPPAAVTGSLGCSNDDSRA